MKILVLGASGLVGGNLMDEARAAGHEVTGTFHQHAAPGLLPLNLDDSAPITALIAGQKPAWIFLCAGWTWVDGCEGDPARAAHANAEIPGLVAQIAESHGARLVFFSTSYVFDGDDGPYSEKAATNPISVYGRSKLEGEKRVLENAPRSIIARTMGVYGPESQQKNFVYQVRRTLTEGKSMRVPQDQFGNITYAPDLAQMALALTERNESGIWNLAGPDPGVRRSDFAIQIAESYGLRTDLIEPVTTASLNQPAPRPVQGGLIVDKAVKATGITPRGWTKLP